MTDIHSATLGEGNRIRVRVGKHPEDSGEVDEFVTYHLTFNETLLKIKELYAIIKKCRVRKKIGSTLWTME